MERARIPGLAPGQRHPDWQSLYERAVETNLPWFSPALDRDFALELKTQLQGQSLRNLARQKILEVGCGLGNQAFLLSEEGYNITATDVSPAAIDRARSAYPDIRFFVDDISETGLKEEFSIILDRGCFHVLKQSQYPGYLNSVHTLLKPRGLLLLKVLSSEQGRRDFGPESFSLLGLHRVFTAHFEILRIVRTVYQGSTERAPLAWFAVMRKRERHG
jgi:SAM-dependent methyltransferase